MAEVSSVLKYCRRVIALGQRQLSGLFNRVWFQWYMRIGHGAKGMLYGLMGLFVINDIVHDQPVISGSEGVLVAIAGRPMGSIMLALLAFGLLGYVLWRFIQAIVAPGSSGEATPKKILQRCGYACSGLAYLGIARSAGQLSLNLAIDFDDTLEDVASVLFEMEIGPWMLLALGFSIVGVGCTYLYGAVTGDYINEFRQELYDRATRWVIAIGKVGITARGVGFILIGLYLLKAGFLVEDNPAGGLGNVFDQLDDHPLGELWLGAIAFGFIAYAIYMLTAAIYRKFPAASP